MNTRRDWRALVGLACAVGCSGDDQSTGGGAQDAGSQVFDASPGGAGGSGLTATGATGAGAASAAAAGAGGGEPTNGGSAGTPGGGTSGTSGAGGAVAQVCNHDGVADPWELCDDGNDDDDDGCRQDCTWTCDPDTPQGNQTCSDGAVCNGAERCGADHRCRPGSPAPNGTRCGDSVECVDGACVFVHCGDRELQADLGEECDDGNAIRGDGCEPDCRWTCLPTDGTRDCRNPCRPGSTCIIGTHLCSFTSALPDGDACPGGTCTSGVCVPN